jgi:pseudaminic acid cytidylyltransferase
MNNIAIIPARGGSKRIPRKNIKNFLGKPIIAYSIIAAIESKLFDEVMVSTDDIDIANIAKFYGATVPFFRSEENSNDFTTTSNVLIEVIKEYEKLDLKFENICCIYATAPFTTKKSLYEGYQLLLKEADTVLPILKFDYPIWRSFNLNENSYLNYNWEKYINTRSQDLPSTFHDAGQWYWTKTEKFLKSGTLFNNKTKGFLLNAFEAHDIDTYQDWKLAELKYDYLQGIKESF